MKILVVSLLPLLLLCSKTLGQAQGPAPAGPTNITKILEKAGGLSTFIRLLQLTQTADRINTQLRKSSDGLTVFAPSDAAFSALKSGTLNSLTDQQKVSLVQFHILPTFLTTSQFQTISNPVRTQAGDSANGAFPLNVTTSGNQVNITTGVNEATVANTIYTDNQLAVYQVDKVLLPVSMFGSPSPAAAPEAPKGSKKKKTADSPVAGGDSPADASHAADRRRVHGVFGVGVAMLATIICL